MESRSPRVVLRAVVAPALGVSLGALLAIGCDREGTSRASTVTPALDRSAAETVPRQIAPPDVNVVPALVDAGGVGSNDAGPGRAVEYLPAPGPPPLFDAGAPRHQVDRILPRPGPPPRGRRIRHTPGPPPPEQLPILGLFKPEPAPEARTTRRTRGSDESGTLPGLAGARSRLR